MGGSGSGTFTASSGAVVVIPPVPGTYTFPPGFRGITSIIWSQPSGGLSIDNFVFNECGQQAPACALTMPVPTAPTNVGTFPPDGMLHYDPMLMRPFDLDDLGGNLIGTLMLPCWRNGNVDIYIVVHQSPYGQLIMNNFHQWLPFPANIASWRANTAAAVYAQLFSYLKSTVAAGTYHLDVVVVPSGTPTSAIPGVVEGTATVPYYKWRFTKTL